MAFLGEQAEDATVAHLRERALALTHHRSSAELREAMATRESEGARRGRAYALL